MISRRSASVIVSVARAMAPTRARRSSGSRSVSARTAKVGSSRVEVELGGPLLGLLGGNQLGGDQVGDRRAARDLGRHRRARRGADDQIGVGQDDADLVEGGDDPGLPGDAGQAHRRPTRAPGHRGALYGPVAERMSALRAAGTA